MTKPVLFLSKAEVIKHLDPRPLVASLAEAFQLHALRQSSVAGGSVYQKSDPSLSTATSLGRLEYVPFYSVKLESHHKLAQASMLHLFDAHSGKLVAIMESSYLSGLGTALTGALAADLLAGSDSKTLAIVGNGLLGWLSLRFLIEMRSIEKVKLFDLNRQKCKGLAERLGRYPQLEVVVSDSLNLALADADIVVCATSSSVPVIYSEMVKPGAHLTVLGSDLPGKRELSDELLRTSSFFCDDRELSRKHGLLSGFSDAADFKVGELGEILSGQVRGRSSFEDITVYSPVGLGFVDLLSACATYKKALRKKAGVQLSLEV